MKLSKKIVLGISMLSIFFASNVFADQRIIARPLVLLPRNLDDGRAPFYGIAEFRAEHRELRRDASAKTVFKLRIGRVHAGFGEKRLRIPSPAYLAGVDMVLLLPS